MYAIKKVRRAVYVTEKLSGSFVPSREFFYMCATFDEWRLNGD